ncbi:MAG: hypothetical protein A2Y21_11790 [Clostridiales bacterium GWC2_40_7]|nr:MAG: hypothetical protein A2Y21_11790 [Clostridiales bacterium GWC2_40_7]
MCEDKGKQNWVFCDGDLPPAGEKEPFGHEALMVTNLNSEQAILTIDILFEDKEPSKGITMLLKEERVICIRLDKPFGDQKYLIPRGQYSLVLHSSIPVVAVFGRLDVRQANLSYYSVHGYAY